MRNILNLLIFVGGTFALLLGTALFADVMRDIKSRDAVFVAAPSCRGDVVICARQLYFNGDWHGVQLCKGKHCVDFDAIFGETK